MLQYYVTIYPGSSYVNVLLFFFIKIDVKFLERPVLEECSDEAFALMNIKARYVGDQPVNV